MNVQATWNHYPNHSDGHGTVRGLTFSATIWHGDTSYVTLTTQDGSLVYRPGDKLDNETPGVLSCLAAIQANCAQHNITGGFTA